MQQVLDTAIPGLNHWEQLVPVLQSLGQRYVDYGVQATHYATVGTALLETLAAVLGKEFTPQIERAWATVYHTMVDEMATATASCP